MSIESKVRTRKISRYAALVRLAHAVTASENLPDDVPQDVVEAHASWIEKAEKNYLSTLIDGEWR